MVGAFVYYSDMATAEAWTKEVAVLKRNLNDSFNTRARVFTFVVSDPKNIKDDLYYPYRRVKLVDTTPDTSVFLGRIEMSDPYWDNEYGQCLKITCIDYSRELYERKLDVDYTVTASPYITAVPYKRSDLIKQIVYDHSYSGNITLNVEDSGSSDLISRDYSGYDRAAIQEIETLSAEDYWTDETWATNTPSGSVWRFNGTSYVNDTINADTVTGSFYWWLGTSHIRYLGLNNPFLGIWLNLSATGNPAGIKYEYWAGTGWVELVMSESFDFTTTTGISRWELPSDWSATAFSSTWPHNGYSPPDTNSRYWVKTTMTGVSTYPQVLQVKAIRGCGYDFYTDDSQVFQRFRRGSKPSGGGENGLTIELNGTNGESTRAMMHDYSFSEQAKELITRVTVRGHDEDGTPVKETATNTTLEDELKIIRERTEYVWGKEMTNSDLTTYCANRANALLEQHAGTYNTTGAAIVRGQVSIIGYPYYGPSKTLVRVGDLVRVKCAPKSIDEDMLVQEIIYDETNIARLKLISVAWGRNFSPFELTSVLESLRLGGDVIISQARINDLVVNEAWINTLNAEKILVNSASGANILTSGINNYATVLISGGLIVDGSINVIKLGSDATDRFFDSSGNANAVQNWIIDSTEINGGYIKTNTVSLNKLVAVPMGLLLDPSFEYSPTGQTCGEGWEIGYGANMTDQIIENSGVARNGTKYLQFVPYATTATERHWYSDPWIKVNQGDIITFGGYISCTGLNSTMGFKLIGADSSFATSELDSTSFIGGSFSWMIRESTYQITGSSINWVRLHCCLNNSASAGTARYDDTFLAVNSLVIIHGSSSGSRVAIDGSGIYGYNGSNVRFVLKTDGSGWLGASASLYWSSAGVVGINGNVLVNGSVVIGKFGTDATDRMFDTSGASNNIQAWQATANATYINGDYIYTNTIQLGALNGSITDRLFNSSGNSDVVQTWITGADIKGTYIQGGSIAVVSLSPAVTDRMFTSSGNSDSVQAWIVDSTLINGGFIKTNTISLNKLQAVPMSWLVDPGFEYSPTGTGGGSGWEPGYVTNLSTINSGIKTTTPRSGSQHLQLAVLASAASERYWYSDPWIKVASGDVITFGGYLRAIGLVGGSAGFRLIVKNAAETTSTFASTTFMGGTFSYISRFETTQITGDAIWARVQCCVTNTASAGTALFDDCSMNENSLVIIHGNPGSSRIAIDGSGIYGYNGSTAQFYIRSTDGAAMCGGGYVKLDSSGIILDSPGETLTIGSPITGGSNTNTVSGYYFLTRFQAEKTSTNMDVALKAAASGIYLWSAEVALYSDSVGSPGTLLGTKQLLGSPDSFYQGWNIYQLSTPGFSVTAGTYYWVGFQAEVSGIVWETGGTGRYSTSLTGWPASNPTMSSNTAIYRIRLLSGALDTTPIKFMNYEEKCAEMYGDTGYDFSNSKGLTMWQQDYMNIKFGSSEGFVVISGRLTVTGHATISSIGNANTVGTIYEGGAAWIKLTGSPGHITIAGNIEPYLGNSYIFGSSAKPWKEIWATGFYSTGHLYVIPNSGQDLWLGVSGRYVVPAYHDTVHLGDVNYRWYDVVTPRINSGNTSDLVMTTPTGYCVRPVNNGQIHLGHVSYRWGNIHCNNLYIAGVRCDYDEYWAAKTPTATGWTTWELSGTLELGTKMVWVVVSNFHSSNQYDGGIRAVGSGSSRYFTLFPGCRLCMPVWVNSSRQIQIYCTNTSYVNFYVLGGVIWPD